MEECEVQVSNNDQIDHDSSGHVTVITELYKSAQGRKIKGSDKVLNRWQYNSTLGTILCNPDICYKLLQFTDITSKSSIQPELAMGYLYFTYNNCLIKLHLKVQGQKVAYFWELPGC